MKRSVLCIILSICWATTNSNAAPTTSDLEQARDKSLAYLILNQNGDGSWGKTLDEKVRITATVLDTFRKYSVTGLVYSRALNWLTNAESYSTDSFARQAYTLARSGVPVDTDHFLTDGINRDSATLWGPSKEYRYTAVDSSLVLKALTAASPDLDVTEALTFLKNRRNTTAVTDPMGAGWSFSDSRYNTKDTSKVYPTAQMLLLLYELGGTNWGQSLDRTASQWLAMQQSTGGVISDSDLLADNETLLAVQALGYAKDVSGAATEILPAYENGLDYIISRQNNDGDIDADLFKTALAGLALFNQNQLLADTDSDGVPDSVELQIGTDPNIIDTEYLEQGNGINLSYVSGGTIVRELIIQQAVTIEMDDFTGTLESVGGILPPGLTVNGLEKTISGFPSSTGFYTCSLRFLQEDESVYLQTVSLWVVDPNYDTDGDGISVAYETTYPSVLNNFDGSDADLDPDGDGLTNYQEFLLGGNPTIQDTDNDSVLDYLDNCISVSNVSQDNFDGDSFGDACDPDDDNDGVLDGDDAFPFDPLEWQDTDGDGLGNNADLDDDEDSINDQDDNCPLISNVNQRDSDHDGIGNACDDYQFPWGVFNTVIQAVTEDTINAAAASMVFRETAEILELQDASDMFDKEDALDLPANEDIQDTPTE